MTLMKLQLLDGETLPQLMAKASEFCGVPFYSRETPCGLAFDEDGTLIVALQFEAKQDAIQFLAFRLHEAKRQKEKTS